ncbi:SMC-Scp complex subunit ScpB [Limobrevibacterium gyesilva]|uniref:SMC-Scp complex subunit ScpB n=1 Tax=Limobrevibacterium gyesilva TaxID=2991712 RepID=UPI0038D1E25F
MSDPTDKSPAEAAVAAIPVPEIPAPDVPAPAIPTPEFPTPEPPGPAIPTPELPPEIPPPEIPVPEARPAGTPAESRAEELDSQVRLAEALLFASAAPVTPRALTQLLANGADVDAVVAALRERYAGRGVELVEIAGGLQFRTAADLAPRLKRVIQVPRRLPRAAMETLAIVAYHQPVTRPEIEEIRGASLSQTTLDSLLDAGLIMPKGRKETPGRPTMWATTPAFLAQFGLHDLRDLPRREDLLVEPPSPTSIGGEAPEAVPETVPERVAEEGTARPADA